jgi:hypothetical protein
VADVSAVADPNTGVAVYDSYGSSGGANWFVYGGTSVAAPLVAGVWALTGSLASAAVSGRVPYAHASGWKDATGGSNGSCGGSYLCTGVAGYDGPTGLGSPIGTSGFGSGSGGGGGGTTNNPPTAAFARQVEGHLHLPGLPGQHAEQLLEHRKRDLLAPGTPSPS